MDIRHGRAPSETRDIRVGPLTVRIFPKQELTRVKSHQCFGRGSGLRSSVPDLVRAIPSCRHGLAVLNPNRAAIRLW